MSTETTNKRSGEAFSDAPCSPDFVYPDCITEEMIHFARTDDDWHFARNLTAMLEDGYCPKCGLVPVGCEREGCRAIFKLRENAEADTSP